MQSGARADVRAFVRLFVRTCVLALLITASPTMADECTNLHKRFMDASFKDIKDHIEEFASMVFSEDAVQCAYFKQELSRYEALYNQQRRVERACGARWKQTCDSRCWRDTIMTKTKSNIEETCNTQRKEQERQKKATADQARRPFEKACSSLVASAASQTGTIESQKKIFEEMSLCNQSSDRSLCTSAVESLDMLAGLRLKELTCDGRAIAMPPDSAFIDYEKVCDDLLATIDKGPSSNMAWLVKTCGAHPSKSMCESTAFFFNLKKKPLPPGFKCTGPT